jgi:hypothetical protein
LGYLGCHLVALVVLGGIWFAGERMAAARNTATAGLLPILAVSYGCFLVVTVYDAILAPRPRRRDQDTPGDK